MNTFTTSGGIEIECQSIEFLLDKLNTQYQDPEPPRYEVKTAGGASEWHPHDETTLESDGDKAAWADYQRRLAETQQKRNAALMKVVLLRGLKIDLPADEAWIEDQKFLGIDVPSDPRERKYHWLTTEVLRAREDYVLAVSTVMGLSGIPEEVVAQAQNSFRGAMGSDPARSIAAAEGDRLEGKPALRGSENGGAGGDLAVAV